MLSNEELLRDRYKCIAPIPFQPAKDMYKVGDIFTDNGKTAVLNQHGDPVFAIKWEDFPHLFQPLPWWSDREISDMPEYLRRTSDNEVVKTGEYIAVGDKIFFKISNDNIGSMFSLENKLPATLAEYEAYQQSKK